MTISPTYDTELLPLADHIISKGPTHDNWEFYAMKQATENWHLLKLDQINTTVDASEWKYVLLKYEDGKNEVLVKADSLSPYDMDTKKLIVEIVLTNLLGEKVFMQRVDYFEVVEEFHVGNGITEIKYLSEHLNKDTFV